MIKLPRSIKMKIRVSNNEKIMVTENWILLKPFDNKKCFSCGALRLPGIVRPAAYPKRTVTFFIKSKARYIVIGDSHLSVIVS